MKLKNLSAVALKSERFGNVISPETVEARLGFTVPEVLRDILVEYPGPVGFDLKIGIEAKHFPAIESNNLIELEILFGFNDGADGLVTMREAYRDRVQEVFVPVADAGAGDLFFWNIDSDQIFFWHHESPNGESSPEAMTLIADTLESFINSLVVFPDEDREIPLPNVPDDAFDFLLDK